MQRQVLVHRPLPQVTTSSVADVGFLSDPSPRVGNAPVPLITYECM
jgi:hypothetical protein